MHSKILSTTLFAMALALSACGSSSKSVERHNLVSNISGLVQDVSQEPTLLFVRPNAPTLADYDSFIIDPVAIDYSDVSMSDLDQDDVTRLQEGFKDRVSSELKDAGYTITDKPGAGTMRISFTLSGVKAPVRVVHSFADTFGPSGKDRFHIGPC